MTIQEKRLMLREKVEASKARLASHRGSEPPESDLVTGAREAGEKATDFVGKHPLASLGAAIALGLFIGSRGKKAPKKPAKRTNMLGALFAEAAIAYGLKLIDKARDDAGVAEAKDSPQ